MPADDLHDADGLEPADGFEREAALLQSLAGNEIELVDAPSSVWSGIEAALDDERGGGATAAPPLDLPVVEREVPVVSLDERRRPRWRVIAGAAAAIVVVAGIGAVVWTGADDGPSEVASTQLTALPGVDVGRASANVRLESDGSDLNLQVEMDDLPPPAPGTFYELWLLDGADGTPVSLAEMRAPAAHVSTTIPVPLDTDTDRFDVVDVSVQHDGAGPEHSGESILRGTLTA